MNNTDAPPKLRRVDPTELTLREMAEISALLDAPLADVLQGTRQAEGIAATAWMLLRRDDPTFTYEQALDLRPMRDIEIVNDTDPKSGRAEWRRAAHVARIWRLNPADVMDLPVGLLDVMDDVIRDENRAQRREMAKAKAHRRH